MIKKNNTEIDDIKSAIRTLNREISENRVRVIKLHPERDKEVIESINSKIYKKEKQKLKLERKLG